MITFEVPGKPRPQGSKRHVGNGRMIESSKYVAGWRERIAVMAHEEMKRKGMLLLPKSVPVRLIVELYFDRPACHFRGHNVRESAPQYHTQKPDVDKVARAIMDGLTGIVFSDDAQVIDQHITKDWSDRDFTVITVGECKW